MKFVSRLELDDEPANRSDDEIDIDEAESSRPISKN